MNNANNKKYIDYEFKSPTGKKRKKKSATLTSTITCRTYCPFNAITPVGSIAPLEGTCKTARAPEGWRFFVNGDCHRPSQLEAIKDTVHIANKISMANPWHNPNKRKKKKQACVVVDSGTNIHLHNQDINAMSRRPTNEIAPSASNNNIQLHSKGEYQLGEDAPLTITSEQAGAPESLLGLGDLASELGMVHILGKSGYNGVKREDAKIQCKKPPLIKGDFHHGRIWRIPVPKGANSKEFKMDHKLDDPTHIANSAYSQKTLKGLAEFLHGSAGFPAHTTWLKAMDNPNFFATWPGLTKELITKYLDKQIPTIMGHMTKVRQGTRSTKLTPQEAAKIAMETALGAPRPHLELNEGHQVTFRVIAVNIMRNASAKKPRPAHKLKTHVSPTDASELHARSNTKALAARNTITPLKRFRSQYTGTPRRPHVRPIEL